MKKKRYTINDIERYARGECRLDELPGIMNYMQTPEGTDDLSRAIDESIRKTSNMDADKQVKKLLKSSRYYSLNEEVRRKKRRRTYIAAASVVLALMVSIGGLLFSGRINADAVEYVDIYVPRGEQREVYFQDGTHIWIAPDSKISFPKYFAAREREISLTGEAYFDVEADKNRPFIVRLNTSAVIVTGTKFNISSYESNEEIVATLNEGAISFRIDGYDKEYELKPSQQLTYNKKNGKIILRRINGIASSADWRKGDISFENTSLKRVMNELSRRYDVDFVLQDKQLENLLFTISFSNEELTNVLSELQLISDIRFIVRDKEVEIRRKNNSK